MNVNLQFLALHHNNLTKIEGLKHLSSLSFLDLSHNQISDFEISEIPVNLMILKMNGNPCVKEKKDYRKSLVVYLKQLEELDKIKVIQAERLAY